MPTVCYNTDIMITRLQIVDFCDKIKTVREQLLLTQEMLAKEIGVSFSTINRWERDKIEPSIRGKRAFYEYCDENKIKFD